MIEYRRATDAISIRNVLKEIAPSYPRVVSGPRAASAVLLIISVAPKLAC